MTSNLLQKVFEKQLVVSHFISLSQTHDIKHKIYGVAAMANKSRYRLVTVTLKIRQFSRFCVLPFLPEPVPSKLRKSALASPGNGSGVRLMLVVRSETPGERGSIIRCQPDKLNK